ncbi:hypothetical protein N7532_004589 [Penicillium argentinense]|uniref:Zn(2)-C6 fungal-type domain-containing protein n=1 Tax=Penicillium argentinense TaxID=1131581 RepID=A0A9W9FQ77_9EURO|nr:uncharacterized protein N7532_004589 [Penicillium argentinense]KAJ5104060.1 hypothetical protein N7532_004589 [Penicillium argentinense]
MLAESNDSPYAGGDAPKLRTACENCRQSKVKCNLSGKNVCTRCLRHGLQCQYGFANRSGKPKGSKNRATLRKLGQLQEDKPPIRGFRGSRLVPPMSDREPLPSVGYQTHITDPMLDDEVCLVSAPPGIWESPRSFGSGVPLETPICPSQLTTVDSTPFTDLVDPCPPLPIRLGYPHTPVTPTFLSPDPLTDGMASPPFGGSVSSPFPSAPCDCIDMQLFHMNRLNHLLAESLPLRLDHSLQAIKATFCACQMFLQCGKCVKDSANLLLVISVVNLTLQLFEYWISRENPRVPRAEFGVDIRYGYYELCQEENRQIRTFLLRGLLLHCRETLSMLTATIDTAGLDTPKLVETDISSDTKLAIGNSPSQPWVSATSYMPGIDWDLLNGNGNNCLLPIITGYESTVESFLQSVTFNECICGSKRATRDESL